MRRLRVMVLTLVVVLVAANAPAWGHGGKSEPPKRVLVLVIDQLRPDYVDKLRHAQREGPHASGSLFRQGLSGPHGVRDRDLPQRDHLREAAAQHGLVG